MNQSLDAYKDDPNIFSISGYALPVALLEFPKDYKQDVCLIPRHCSWGWAIWQDRWQNIDWDVKDYGQFKQDAAARRRFNRGGHELAASLDLQMRGEVDSWAIRCAYTGFRRGQYTVYPWASVVDNIGLDGTGVHCGETPEFRNDLRLSPATWTLPKALAPDQKVIRLSAAVYKVLSTRTAMERLRTKPMRYYVHPFVRHVAARAAA